MANEKSPRFDAGQNIAMKIPSQEFSQVVTFYRDIVGLALIEEDNSSTVFEFGGKRLWLDKVDHLSRAEIWLEIQTDDVQAASEFMKENGIVRCDEIESLPEGFKGFWICNPANIIHLVSEK
jgi:hypothetical protein